MSAKVYEIITNKLIEKIESGVVPWVKPWKGAGAMNFDSGKEYRGINCLLTSGGSTPYFMGLGAIRDHGGRVKDGEFFNKAYQVVFWHFPKKKAEATPEDEEDGSFKGVWMRYYNVWNLDQIENLPEDYVELRKLKYEGARNPDTSPIEEAEKIVFGMPDIPVIMIGSKACYRPSTDEVFMPDEERFTGMQEYYSTLLHELIHSTGHKKRLDRKGIMEIAAFGDRNYSEEELVAEMGSAFLCGVAGIDVVIDNQASYLASWLKVLKETPKMLINSAQRAQKAADYILNIKKEKAV